MFALTAPPILNTLATAGLASLLAVAFLFLAQWAMIGRSPIACITMLREDWKARQAMAMCLVLATLMITTVAMLLSQV